MANAIIFCSVFLKVSVKLSTIATETLQMRASNIIVFLSLCAGIFLVSLVVVIILHVRHVNNKEKFMSLGGGGMRTNLITSLKQVSREIF